MTASRRHGWTKGPTNLLLDAISYEVHYRGRKVLGDGSFGEWSEGRIRMVVRPTQEDPLGMKALEGRIRFARERARIELQVLGIRDTGDEVPLQGSKERISKTVDSETYEGLKRKQGLVFPGHPLWDKHKLVH